MKIQTQDGSTIVNFDNVDYIDYDKEKDAITRRYIYTVKAHMSSGISINLGEYETLEQTMDKINEILMCP